MTNKQWLGAAVLLIALHVVVTIGLDIRRRLRLRREHGKRNYSRIMADADRREARNRKKRENWAKAKTDPVKLEAQRARQREENARCRAKVRADPVKAAEQKRKEREYKQRRKQQRIYGSSKHTR